jgi:DNA-binding response OmpR family regulator
MVMAQSDVSQGAEDEGISTLGNLSLNLNTYRVLVGSRVVNLTFHELDLLRIFFRQPDRVLPYDDITRFIWGNSQSATLRHLNVLVHRLRAKLTGSSPYSIETVRGRGYGLLKSLDMGQASE